MTFDGEREKKNTQVRIKIGTCMFLCPRFFFPPPRFVGMRRIRCVVFRRSTRLISPGGKNRIPSFIILCVSSDVLLSGLTIIFRKLGSRWKIIFALDTRWIDRERQFVPWQRIYFISDLGLTSLRPYKLQPNAQCCFSYEIDQWGRESR